MCSLSLSLSIIRLMLKLDNCLLILLDPFLRFSVNAFKNFFFSLRHLSNSFPMGSKSPFFRNCKSNYQVESCEWYHRSYLHITLHHNVLIFKPRQSSLFLFCTVVSFLVFAIHPLGWPKWGGRGSGTALQSQLTICGDNGTLDVSYFYRVKKTQSGSLYEDQGGFVAWIGEIRPHEVDVIMHGKKTQTWMH